MHVAVWDSQAYADVANSRFQSLEGSAHATATLTLKKDPLDMLISGNWPTSTHSKTTVGSIAAPQGALLTSTFHELPRGAVLLLPHPAVTELSPYDIGLSQRQDV